MKKEEDVVQVFYTLVGFVAAYDKLIDDLVTGDPASDIHERSPPLSNEPSVSLADRVLSIDEDLKTPCSRLTNLSPTHCHSSPITSPIRTSICWIRSSHNYERLCESSVRWGSSDWIGVYLFNIADRKIGNIK